MDVSIGLVHIDTTNMFICGGAFVGLDKIVITLVKGIGFNSDVAQNVKGESELIARLCLRTCTGLA